MRHALVVFTKVPKAGHTKTRLTEAKGGILTPEEACDFYTASLLDVIDAGIASAVVDIYICYEQQGDVGHLSQLLNTVAEPEAIKGIFADQGGTFDQAMQYAVDYIFSQELADSVLVVGGDMPVLQPETLRIATRKLEMLADSKQGHEMRSHNISDIGAAVVGSADQEAGFNIIGYTCNTPFTITGIFYNRQGTTALEMLVNKVITDKIPFSVLEMVPDVDLPVDLAGLIPVIQSMQVAGHYDREIKVPQRTAAFIENMGLQCTAYPTD